MADDTGLALCIRDHFMDALGLGAAAAESLVATSREALRRALAELEQALRLKDFQRAGFWAHNVKGNLLNTGQHGLAALAVSIEKAADNSDTDLLARALGALQQELAPFLAC